MTPTVPARVEPGRTEAAREDMAVIGLGIAEPPRDIIVSGNWSIHLSLRDLLLTTDGVCYKVANGICFIGANEASDGKLLHFDNSTCNVKRGFGRFLGRLRRQNEPSSTTFSPCSTPECITVRGV